MNLGEHMSECTVALTGSAITEVSRHTTSNGRTLARFRIIVPERRFDRSADRYVERDPSYYTVIAWGHVAENVLANIHRGDAVVVSGQLRVREWQTAEGVARTTTEVTANAIGHDLAARGKSMDRQMNARLEQVKPDTRTDAA